MSNDDAVVLLKRIEKILFLKGHGSDADLKQTMFMVYLEESRKNPDMVPDMNIIFLKSLEKIKPRDRSNGKTGFQPKDALWNTSDVTDCDGNVIYSAETTSAKIEYQEGGRLSKRKKELSIKMRAAKYLARMEFGHLPFII